MVLRNFNARRQERTGVLTEVLENIEYESRGFRSISKAVIPFTRSKTISISAKSLSERMFEAGIPGIKYRAAGSRGAGVDDAAAKRNYVIFDDKMIKILEKYGIAGPVAITGIAASQEEGKGDGKAA